MGEVNFLGTPAPNWPSPDSTTDGNGHGVPVATGARDGGASAEWNSKSATRCKCTHVDSNTDIGTVNRSGF